MDKGKDFSRAATRAYWMEVGGSGERGQDRVNGCLRALSSSSLRVHVRAKTSEVFRYSSLGEEERLNTLRSFYPLPVVGSWELV